MRDRFLRFLEVKHLTGLSRSTIWRLSQMHQFPRSRKIGRSAVAWLESEIMAWIKERAEARS